MVLQQLPRSLQLSSAQDRSIHLNTENFGCHISFFQLFRFCNEYNSFEMFCSCRGTFDSCILIYYYKKDLLVKLLCLASLGVLVRNAHLKRSTEKLIRQLLGRKKGMQRICMQTEIKSNEQCAKGFSSGTFKSTQVKHSMIQ